RDRGRIWRVVPAGWKPPARKLPAAASREELVAMLAHPNGWHRLTASRLLCEQGKRDRQAAEEIASLTKDFFDRTDSDVGRLHALMVLARLNELTESTLWAALADPAAHVRRHALRLAEPRIEDTPEWNEHLGKLANDA